MDADIVGGKDGVCEERKQHGTRLNEEVLKRLKDQGAVFTIQGSG